MNAQQQLTERKKEHARKQAENDLLNRQIGDMEKDIIGLVGKMEIAQEGLSFLEAFANERRGAMKGKIESVITEAMQLIYDKSYSCELTYSVKNNRSHLAIEMVRKTSRGEVRREIGGFGGGMADTMSVPMRLMVLMGSKQTDRVCAVDECWKMIDSDRVELVGKFMRLLADRLGIQVVFCSHHTMLRDFADRTFHVEERDGTSTVEAF